VNQKRLPAPGALLTPTSPPIRLARCREEGALAVRCDADAGVLDLDAQVGLAAAVVAERLRLQFHPSRLGELHGVAQQVDDHLPQPRRVAPQPGGQVIRVEDQLQRFLARVMADQLEGTGHQVVDGEVYAFERHLGGADLRQIEHVVDDLQQVPGRAVDLGQAIAHGRFGGVAQQQVGQADDGIHRRPDLVAHVGEELRLGAGRRLRLFDRLRELRAGALDLGGARPHAPLELLVALPDCQLVALLDRDVACDLGRAGDAARPVDDGRDRHRDLDQRPVAVDPLRLEVRHALAGGDALQQDALLVYPVGREDGGHGSADHLVGAIAEDPLGRGIPARDDAVERLADDRVVGSGHDGGQVLRHGEGLRRAGHGRRSRLRLIVHRCPPRSFFSIRPGPWYSFGGPLPKPSAAGSAGGVARHSITPVVDRCASLDGRAARS
jgi:hypothetical protein